MTTIPFLNHLPSVAITAVQTSIAMIAFAANSLLCRLALRQELIDAASFATVRVISGALMLFLIVLPHWKTNGRPETSWRSATMLFTYMAFFSFAYLSLSAGTGALILFAAVQLTMFTVAIRSGEQFPLLSWAGLALAVIGLIYLVSPGITAPDPLGALLMTVAGIAWGVYSLLGKGCPNPLAATANNFIYSVPLVIVVSFLFLGDLHISPEGLALAASSGAIASGLGYTIWYAALRGLKPTSAATVQLSAPVIAAFGGVLLLSEPITLRLILASTATLGGVAIVLTQRNQSLK
ncbi:DMT family transporter [Solemya elarraichensis gill symbiont]|uniref:EamA family transporter n=1 Tax=Solemya elarraichensis gill symbiont TaxID=1918949 RepID=A0A1T2KUD6_9GAMM|nr:DMT family transporter [Solemya elarraichensis gill symbiont]OOZ36340.1 EamA family transporter [Solemya elarraichensis gill symbiont]